MKSLVILLLFVTTFIASAEFKFTPENLRDGKLVKDSESSKNVGLFCIHRGETTATAMVLMDKSRSKILGEIPIRSTYSTPRSATEWLEVVWNAEGTAVAIHDSLDRDSKVLIYHIKENGEFQLVTLPDLRVLNAKRIGIDVSKIKSSGQSPLSWQKERMVMVEFRYVTENGKHYRRQYGIALDEKWQYVQQ